ncbi:hypothetical protein N7463_001688 [Penicillium fimorum]|uniref:RNase H type-1 domain-containing protein n=1 Tax=Penicillium fimorum TaxID=1882269 RepID=A0A9X0C7T5_9EURO|nr:hypothetical protein N7463_001688 [Penicillium fimorum]
MEISISSAVPGRFYIQQIPRQRGRDTIKPVTGQAIGSHTALIPNPAANPARGRPVKAAGTTSIDPAKEALGQPIGLPVLDPRVPLVPINALLPHERVQAQYRATLACNPDPEHYLGGPTPLYKTSTPERSSPTPISSPTPSQGEVLAEGNESSLSFDQSFSQLEPNEKIKTKQDADKRFSWQLGHDFVGFVSLLDGRVAFDIANNILQLPIPPNVCKRLVYFCDASIRSAWGAVGIVWSENFTSTNWVGTGVCYPDSIESTATLELFAIARTLKIAIEEIDTDHAGVSQDLLVDRLFFQPHLHQTRSNSHQMSKEVFIFTDDIFALRRIGGHLAYLPDGNVSRQLEEISRHSETLSQLGVHLELHLSPGHCGIPGNEAADMVAKMTQNELERKKTRLTTESAEDEPANVTPGPSSGTS